MVTKTDIEDKLVKVLNETITLFRKQSDDIVNTLFLFFCREADEVDRDCVDASEYKRQLKATIFRLKNLQDFINRSNTLSKNKAYRRT